MLGFRVPIPVVLKLENVCGDIPVATNPWFLSGFRSSLVNWKISFASFFERILWDWVLSGPGQVATLRKPGLTGRSKWVPLQTLDHQENIGKSSLLVDSPNFCCCKRRQGHNLLSHLQRPVPAGLGIPQMVVLVRESPQKWPKKSVNNPYHPRGLVYIYLHEHHKNQPFM